MQLQLKIKINLLLTTILVAGLFSELAAQTYDEARKFAFGGERAKARSICKQILSEGFNSDVALLLGRTYAWDGLYDSARVVLNEVLMQKPGNMEAYDALSDVEYWSGNYEKAVNILEDYLRKNSGQEEFIRKLRDYRLDLMKNKIKINYTVDFFEKDYNRDPWQITALSYSRKTKLGSVVARANYANRFGNKGFQYEIDAYPKFTENSYVYLNYGFSNNSLFPKNRYGMEWYQNLPKAFETSLGMRLLQFSDSYVDIYTATIGKYAGNYWFSLRSYVTPDTTGTSVSGSLQVRRYFSDPENYLGFKMGHGVSPDESRDIFDSAQRLNLKKGSLRLDYNHILNHRFIVNVGAEWGSEETQPGTMSSYYSFDASIAWVF